jgi:ABC-type transport system substrate-binding protein
MTRFKRAFPVVVSVCLAGGALNAARPHYGGMLRIGTTDAGAMRRVNALAYETLAAVDESGGLRPMLATSWEIDARGRRWTFHVRRGVRLHDGSTLQPPQVMAALQGLHADWQITSDGDAIAIDPGRDAPDLPWRLAEAAQAIVVRPAAGPPVGSGPFRVERVEGGLIRLRAHDDYWGSRPFVDTVEVRTGRTPAEWLADVEAGRADMVPIQPTDVRRLEQRQLRIEASRPLELVAQVFEPPLATTANDALRRTFAAAIDRGALARVVLQGQAQPANALLPEWISGYAPFALAKVVAQPMSRSAIAALPPARRTLALRVSAADAVGQALAQRIAVNARDAGFTLAVQAPPGLGPPFDVRLVRLPFRAAAPADALADLMTGLGTRTIALVGRPTPPESDAAIDAVVRTERGLLERDVIIPIVHVPELYAVSDRLQSWNGPAVLPSGMWNLANIWLSAP